MVQIDISPEYGYVILAAAAMQLQIFHASLSVSKMRKKHKVTYPDMGSGRHAAKLDDKCWEEFNNYQRVHQNYLEAFTGVTTNLLVGGLFFPRVQATLGAIYIVSRFLYAYGYTRKGSSGRMFGAISGFFSNFSMLGVMTYGALQTLGYF